MGELRSTSPAHCLDLSDLEPPGAERDQDVFTTPCSLESCGVKPVQLLIKSLNTLITEQQQVPFEAMTVMHESYEKERLKLSQRCHDEQQRIIQATAARRPDSKASRLKVLRDAKVTVDRPYADLCFKGKSGSRSSCSAASKRDTDRSTVYSLNLGNLTHSQATKMKLQKLKEDIKKEMCVTVSDRDCKIAALMLVRHQQEQDHLKLCQKKEQERQEACKREKAQQAQAEKMKRRKLKQSLKHWNEGQKARMRLRECREKDKAGQHEQEVLLQEDRCKRLKEEVEAQRREKIAFAQKKTEGRKHYQEKLLREKEEMEKKEREKERQLAVEREQKARKNKALKEEKEQKMLQEENRRELLHHILLKRQMEQQVEEEEAQMRSRLEKKLQRSTEKRTKSVQARLREVQERAAQQEEQIQRAKLRAKLQSIQQLTHKMVLVQQSQRRMERAAMQQQQQHRNRAEQTQEQNKHRQLCHQRIQEKMEREQEEVRKVRESYISMKEWKRERLQRQRKKIQEEAQRLALASFHMRERVRQQTHSRTFDQMALEAQLAASITRMNL
ncbi:uncharacterized protein KZ484_011150 [Pholidichthys leucotaenia]